MVRASPATSFANVPTLQGTAAHSYILWLGRDAPWAKEKAITQMPGRIELSDYTDEEWEALRRPIEVTSVELKAHLQHSILNSVPDFHPRPAPISDTSSVRHFAQRFPRDPLRAQRCRERRYCINDKGERLKWCDHERDSTSTSFWQEYEACH